MRRLTLAIVAGLISALALSACGETATAKPTGQQQENTSRQSNYNQLVKNQPAHSMSYSPTRATKNFWIDTWNKPGKLAYVYLMNGSGNVFGYFITVGLPVSYCTGLVVPYTTIRTDGGEYSQDTVVPAPSIDGTFSSGSNCDEYYGKDAVSGSYVEYSVGMGINALIFDQPMPQYGDAAPLGKATVKTATAK